MRTDPFYNDADGQGAGVGQCSQQFPNPVTNSLDCNDNNENAYVGAIELCDGVDNDCDGEIDDDCVGEGEIFPHCQKDPEIDFIWETDDNNFCQEREFQETTTFTPTSEQCDYVENDPTITSTGGIRNKADGTTCPTGFCNDGQCVPTCEHQCLPEKPDNSIEVTAQSCAGINSCYKCANNMIWDRDECVNTGYQIVNVNSMTVEDQKTYTIDPILKTDEGDEKNAVFTYQGLINRKTTRPLTLLADGIGTRTLTITASRLQGTQEIQAATKTIEITTVFSIRKRGSPLHQPCTPVVAILST